MIRAAKLWADERRRGSRIGAFYAVAPTFAGGDLNRSYEHFQECLIERKDELR